MGAEGPITVSRLHGEPAALFGCESPSLSHLLERAIARRVSLCLLDSLGPPLRLDFAEVRANRALRFGSQPSSLKLYLQRPK